MLRIIAERDSTMNWRAWWNDSPPNYEVSGDMFGAVAKLLSSNSRGCSMEDLVEDQTASRPWHAEWTVVKQGGTPD
jgi:hypothetical protein